VWGGYIIAGPIETFSIVQVVEGVYDGFDYNDSVVLDIGGFIGDTALFFIAKGAKKVIVYEPVPENADEIIRNAAINGLSGRVIVKPFAVTDTDGYIEVIKSKDYGTVGFSVLAQYTGETVKLPSRSWQSVLLEGVAEGVDVAKVDCEGCEVGLLSVDPQLIAKVPRWIIETHTKKLSKCIMELFTKLGYECVRTKEVKTKEGKGGAYTQFIHFFISKPSGAPAGEQTQKGVVFSKETFK
jgi:FkbM family methyltransferase